MREVYTAQDQEDAYMVRDLQVANGFDVVVRGEFLVGFGLPLADRYPSVWVKNNDDFDAARVLVEEFLRARAEAAAHPKMWDCPKCGETLEEQFAQCWQCGAERPEDEAE